MKHVALLITRGEQWRDDILFSYWLILFGRYLSENGVTLNALKITPKCENVVC